MDTEETETVIIPATKLRRDMGAVLDAVLSGMTIHVERGGRPSGVIVPPREYDLLVQSYRAAAAEERMV